MFKMTKKKWLSMLTVAAVVVTMTASFAAWDNLTATKTFSNTTIVQRVDVKTDGATALTTTGEAGSYTSSVPTYSGTAQFTVDGDATTLGGKKLTVEPKVTIDSVDATTKFDITVKETNAGSTTDILTNGDETLTGGTANTYDVTLTPKEANYDDVSGKTIAVELNGSLVDKTTP